MPRAATAVLTLLGALACAYPVSAWADETSGRAAEDGAGTPIWQRAQETAGDWWQRSRNLAGQAVDDARGLVEEDRGFERVWSEVVPKLDETLTLEERSETLPETAWFGADQVSNRADIDALMDEMVGILSTSPAQGLRERIRAIQAEIAQARSDISGYRQQRISAPREGAFKRTVSDYDDLIDAREDDIARLRRELDLVKREFAKSVRELGVELSDEQVEFLLSTVVGDNMVDLGILFDNARSVTDQLEGLVAESGEDLDSSRRYYGMYVVLLRVLRHMHERIEAAIGEDYVPRIDSIIARARELSAETQRLQRQSPGKRELLASNLEAQRMTMEAAALYRQYLMDQRNQVSKARAELDKDIAAAWNTYETVRVSGELVGLVRSSQQMLESLMNRQVPALRPFENLELQREFDKLTDQLRAQQAGG